jgi:hypothetical protein
MTTRMYVLVPLAGGWIPAQAAVNLDTANAPVEVIFQDISPSGGDATLVLRVTTLRRRIIRRRRRRRTGT